MPKLIIDNREIEVPKGTKVIEAAEKLGIVIPRFCFHPSLGISGGLPHVCGYIPGRTGEGHKNELHGRGEGRHGGLHHGSRGH